MWNGIFQLNSTSLLKIRKNCFQEFMAKRIWLGCNLWGTILNEDEELWTFLFTWRWELKFKSFIYVIMKDNDTRMAGMFFKISEWAWFLEDLSHKGSVSHAPLTTCMNCQCCCRKEFPMSPVSSHGHNPDEDVNNWTNNRPNSEGHHSISWVIPPVNNIINEMIS